MPSKHKVAGSNPAGGTLDSIQCIWYAISEGGGTYAKLGMVPCSPCSRTSNSSGSRGYLILIWDGRYRVKLLKYRL